MRGKGGSVDRELLKCCEKNCYLSTEKMSILSRISEEAFASLVATDRALHTRSRVIKITKFKVIYYDICMTWW